MVIKTKAPGKLILIGEYVVLEGAPALVCSVDREVVVVVEKSDRKNTISASALNLNEIPFNIENKQIVFSSDVPKEAIQKLVFFKNTFDYCLQNIGKDLPGSFFKINIDTDAFYSEKVTAKLGFGSSAALTVALIKALFKLNAININEQDNRDLLFQLSLAAHKKAQENVGSGIDIAASCYAGVLKYQVGLNENSQALVPQIVELWEELAILTIFTGKSESTRKMVFGVNQLKKEKPNVFKELMRELQATSLEGIKAYEERNIFGFMNAVKTFHTQMDMLGKNSGMPIISEVHKKIAAIVQKNLGVYKPSGAGSGDIGIAIAETQDQISHIRQSIEHAGFQCIDVKLGLQG